MFQKVTYNLCVSLFNIDFLNIYIYIYIYIIAKRKLDQEGDNSDDVDVYFTTTYGVLQEVTTEDDKQKVLEFLINYSYSGQKTKY